jgi:hypothetical protein
MEFDNKLKAKPFRFDRKGAGPMSKKVFSDMEAQMDQGKSLEESMEATAPKPKGSFFLNGQHIAAANYNPKGFYEFYDVNGRKVADIQSEKLSLSKDPVKSFFQLADMFGDE